MSQILYRLGKFTVRFKWAVLVAWLVALVLVGFAVRELGAETSNNLSQPGTDSQEATDLLAERFPPQQNGANPVVFHATDGKVTEDPNEQAIRDSRKAILEIGFVHSARSPFSQKGQGQISEDERTAFIPVLLSIPNGEITEKRAERVLDAADPARAAGMQVAVGGQIGSVLSKPDTGSSDVIGIAMAMLILAFTFGTLVAMGLPIVSAVFGLLVGLSLIGLLGHIAPVPEIAPTLAVMIGLGVGIDYALFLVARYRTELAAGKETAEAVATAVSTSGSAIVFAGSTVVLALLALIVAGIPLVTSLGYASALAVITAVLAALTLLPAILASLGPRIHWLPIPGLHRGDGAAPAALMAGFWGRWATLVTTHPWRSIGLVLLILIPAIIPFFALNLGQEDIGATPKSTTERQAYDLLAAGFGPGYNGPLLVAVGLDPPAEPSKKFTSQKNEAEDLEAELEQEQAEGEQQAAFLENQAAGLQTRQGVLEDEESALESQRSGLRSEESALEAERARIAREVAPLRAELDSIAQGSRQVGTEGARLAAEEARLRARLNANLADQQRVEDELAQNPPPAREEELERELARLQERETELEQEIAVVNQERAANRSAAQQLERQAAEFRRQVEAVGGQSVALGEEAAALAAEAVGLAVEGEQLQQEAAQAEIEAANLRADEAELEAEKMVAEAQEEQAEELKKELTKELTAAGGDERGTDRRLVSLQNGLNMAIGVQLVSPPDINESGNAAIFDVVPASDPADPATADLVLTVRDFVIPERTQGEDVQVHVGGVTAANVDLAAGISSRLPFVIVIVIALGFLVLMMAFRSILIPTQAALINLLSISAAFGVVVACFQFGWGLDLIGLETDRGTDPIASFVPLIMFAVLFGLSMDYQVFLLSQIEQQRAGAADMREAIARGLAGGARVITAAALIMIAVFASFILNGDPTVKQFGVGLSVGVALAAMSVLIFAPAFLVLVRRAIFWLPGWAERHLPHIDIEGAARAEEADQPTDD
ncbi:MAG: MMPL family transporter [Solirubrobacterales bacterium]